MPVTTEYYGPHGQRLSAETARYIERLRVALEQIADMRGDGNPHADHMRKVARRALGREH